MQLVDVPTLGSRLAGSPADIRVRRLLLARFPYVVVFVEVGDEIRVIAVMHAKRRPGRMRRLEK